MNTSFTVDKSLKDIHIGKCIEQKVTESNLPMISICNYFKLDEDDIRNCYKSEDISATALLKWSRLLNYDFFRLYSGHLMLYSSSSRINQKVSVVPVFRKNIYTKEVKDYLLEIIYEKKKTIAEVIEIYGIPKTTLYNWLKKNLENNQNKTF